jgi:hypothetical protein
MVNFVAVPVMRGFVEIRELYDICQENRAYVAGGYARYMASMRSDVAAAGDVDIYAAQGKSDALVNVFFDLGYTLAGETDNAYTLNNPTQLQMPKRYTTLSTAPRAQIIKSDWTGPTMEDTLQLFDFTIVMAGLKNPSTVLVHPDFIADDCAGRLIFHNVGDPVRAVLRAMKYARRGYTMTPGQVLKILDEVHYDDCNDISEDLDYEEMSEYWEDVDDRWNETDEW